MERLFRLLAVGILLLCPVQSSASGPVWIWMNGDLPRGAYGIQGKSGQENTPGPRSSATSWQSGGSLFYFGGYGNDSNGNGGRLSDLWLYDAETNEWTWVKGSKDANQPSVYGTQGSAAASNLPGARSEGASWVGADGKLWTMGGYGVDSAGEWGELSDLWIYDVSGNEDVGGLVGDSNYGIITNCYATGAVSGSYDVGGLVGYNNGLITICYWDTQSTGRTRSSGGIGKTTAQMKRQATFVDWDFSTVWKISEWQGYPCLRALIVAPPARARSEWTVYR